MTSFGGVEGLAFVHTKYSNISQDWPDFEIHMVAGSVTTDEGRGIRQLAGLTDEVRFVLHLFHRLITR